MRVAGECNVEVEYWRGIGRPPPEAVFQPIDATPVQRECYFSGIRQFIAEEGID